MLFLVGSVSLEARFRKMKLMDKKIDTSSSKQNYVRGSKFEPKIDKHVFQTLEVTLQLVCFRVRESTAANEDP